jgi:hypothetical protein
MGKHNGAKEMSDTTKIFVSYSHDSEVHADRVLALANQLRDDGIDAILDQYITSPPEGWPRWMDKQIRDANFVVMVCTETYYRRVMGEEQPGQGLGVRWEGNLIYQYLYDNETVNRKFIPILFEGGKPAHIPVPVKGVSFYYVETLSGYEEFYRRLTDQPRARRRELGKLHQLPSRERKWSEHPPLSQDHPANQSGDEQPQQQIAETRMTDPILEARLDMLEQNLCRVRDSASLLRLMMERKSMELESFEDPERLLNGLEKTIGLHANEHLIDLEEIREMLTKAKEQNDATAQERVRKAWHLYNKVYQQSQDTFDECLTFMGGLTFRERGLDKRICTIADYLIHDCADQSGTEWKSLTVPALREAVDKTMALIIRLRFQEWTIWTLPFTAHEFGHVVVASVTDSKDSIKAREFIEEEVEHLMNSDPYLQDLLQNKGAERARDCARFHLNEFLADAFATYTMGPAYACTAILLRFNPSQAYADDEEHPADVKRAQVVFNMLKQMDSQAGKLSYYKEMIDYLEKEWKDALERARLPDIPSAPDTQYLDSLVERISKPFFYTVLLPAVLYPPIPGERLEEGWTVAQQWAGSWYRQLQSEQTLSIPRISSTHKLRDALNAAWLCRIQKSGNVREIAEAAQELCESIIAERRSKPSSKSRKQSKTPPAAFRK